MKFEAQLIQLQAWTQEEISAQGLLLDVLHDMEQAVRTGHAETLSESGAALEKSLLGNRRRERTRAGLMRELSQYFGIPVGIMSLSSVIERASREGHNMELLGTLRDRLRERVQKVSQCSHLLSVMASHHQGVLADLLTIIGGASMDDATRKHGVLVDAKA